MKLKCSNFSQWPCLRIFLSCFLGWKSVLLRSHLFFVKSPRKNQNTSLQPIRKTLVPLWMMWFPFFHFTSFSREFMNSYASFSGRNKSLPPAGLSICSLNGFSVCVWIFGTILLLWNHSSWPQTSLRNHFGLCCWNGRPLFCHPAFTPYGRCDWKTDYR